MPELIGPSAGPDWEALRGRAVVVSTPARDPVEAALVGSHRTLQEGRLTALRAAPEGASWNRELILNWGFPVPLFSDSRVLVCDPGEHRGHDDPSDPSWCGHLLEGSEVPPLSRREGSPHPRQGAEVARRLAEVGELIADPGTGLPPPVELHVADEELTITLSGGTPGSDLGRWMGALRCAPAVPAWSGDPLLGGSVTGRGLLGPRGIGVALHCLISGDAMEELLARARALRGEDPLLPVELFTSEGER